MRKLSLALAVLSVFFLPYGAWAQPSGVYGKGGGTRLNPPSHSSVLAAGANQIDFNGGPVLDTAPGSPTKLYYIWYGDWTQDPGANNILTTYANSVGGSPYFSINTTYYNASSANVVNQAAYGGSFTVNTYPSSNPPGVYAKTLTDTDIYNIVASVSPTDTNGVYFVLTSPDVGESTGFCTSYCGWHTAGSIGGRMIKYSFVGDAATACPGACEWQAKGPNSPSSPPYGGGDGMVSVVAHEFEESVTDPQPNSGWVQNSTGQENADKCAWTFGTTSTAPNGALYNMTLGGLNYLIQQNWVNASGGYCALSYAASPDFTLSATPTTQTVNVGGGSTSYTINVGSTADFTGSVTLSVSSPSPLPTGLNVSWVGNPVTAPGSATLNVTTTSALAAGTYTLTVQGVSGSLTHTTSVTLNVADFTISASPSSRTISAGTNTTYTVSIGAIGGFSGTVSLSVSSPNPLPAGMTASFSPASMSGSGNSTLTVTTSSSTPTGPYTLTIMGTGPASSHSVNVSLTVNPPTADFTISASPASQSVVRGSQAIYTVTVGSVFGFSSAVNLSVTGLPSRSTASFVPSSVTPPGGGTATSTLTVTTGSKSGGGTSTLTITGTSGSLSHMTTVTLTVTPH